MDKNLITQAYKDTLDNHLNTRQLLTYTSGSLTTIPNNSLLVTDTSILFKTKDTNYYGLKFAANTMQFQVNSDKFQTIFHDGNYTSWVVPKTGGTFSGNVSFQSHMYFNKYGLIQNIYGVDAIYFKNEKVTSGNGWAILYTSPQDPNTNNTQPNFLINPRGVLLCGGGESTGTMYTFYLNHDTDATAYPLKENETWVRNSEKTYFTSDNELYILTNCQTATARYVWSFDRSGNFLVPQNTNLNKKVRNIAVSTSAPSSLNTGEIVLVY